MGEKTARSKKGEASYKKNFMRPLRDTDTDGFNYLIFSPDPVSRFRYEKVPEAKKGLAGHYAERILMLQGYAVDLGALMGLHRTKIEMEKTKSFGAGLPCTRNPGPGDPRC